MREALLRLFPSRYPVPPEPVILEGVATDYGVRELIEYAVAPRERIRAYLLTPRARGRRPGVLASHQHGGKYWIGKSQPAGLSKDPMYHYGVDLCRQGYVVLCPDHLGFEDRAPREIDRREGTRPANREYEGWIFADQIIRGSSLTAKYVFDMCQGLDVLESHDRVRADCLGVLGHSLGGLTALWHAFYDERIRVAFSSCSVGTFASVHNLCIPRTFAAYLPLLLNVGDIDDVVAAIAPRAFGMSHGSEDALYPMDGVRQLYRKARQAFPNGKLLTIIFEGPHQFPDSVKRRAYAFFRSHLKG